MENVITLGKLIGLLFCLLSSLLLFVENSKNTGNELARHVMGTILLVVYVFVYFSGCLKEQLIFYELFCEGPSALRKYALTAVRGLRRVWLILAYD